MPDQPRVASPGLVRCENVLPTARGYSPFPGRSAVVGKDALAGECFGAWAGIAPDSTKFIVAGTEDGGVSSGPALYLVWGEGGAVWDVSPVSAITGFDGDGTWCFTRVGDKLIATAPTIDGPLVLDIDPVPTSSSDFAALSSDASKAAVCAEFKDFLILGNVEGRGNNTAIGTLHNGLHWSALGNPASWPTVGTQAARDALSDFQALGGEGGDVTNIVPAGEYCLVFQENAVWRMDFVGLPSIFSFRNIAPSTGCIVRHGAVAAGNLVYFLSEDGFKVCDGAGVRDIGVERVDDTFLSLFDSSNSRRTNAVYLPSYHSVMWTVPEGPNAPTRIFGYQIELNRWFQIAGQDSYQWLFDGHSLAIGGSLDDPPLSTQNMDTGSDLSAANLDLLGVAEGGGVPMFFDQNNDLAFYGNDAAPMTALLETGDYEDPEGTRMVLRWVRPVYNGPDGFVVVQAAGRNYSREEPDYKALSLDTTRGIAKVRSNARIGGRYIRALLVGVGEYDELQGFDFGVGAGRARR